MTVADDHAIRLALAHGLLGPEQVEAARQRAPGAVVATLLSDGMLDTRDLARLMAEDTGRQFVELVCKVPTREAADVLPPAVAFRHRAFPLELALGRLVVAIADPYDFQCLDLLHFETGYPIHPLVATPVDLHRALGRYVASGQPDGATPIETAEKSPDRGENATSEEAPVIQAVQDIIAEAVRRRASDIHLEPLEHRFRVRYRVDGVLQEASAPDKSLQAAIVSRVKILANISIAERRLPQDGRMRFLHGGRELDLRVATMPTAHGESVVLRLLDRAEVVLGLPELGLAEEDQALFTRALAAPDGLILVTGPTGSGKTTTLYAALNRLNDRGRKLITVEDPVEYQIPGINQVPVNPLTGLTFASALRAMLRQAPNVVMVGEIRDGETAEIAINASLTGHLVFSTLHTNDAPGALARLLDIGVKPFLVAASLRLVVAQRLVRRVCEACARPHDPAEHELALLGLARGQVAAATIRRGAGCPACLGTGYRGRLGLFELLEVGDSLRPLIYEPVTAARVREIARRAGMRTLREDGVRKVLAGLTTIEEVAAVTVAEVSP